MFPRIQRLSGLLASLILTAGLILACGGGDKAASSGTPGGAAQTPSATIATPATSQALGSVTFTQAGAADPQSIGRALPVPSKFADRFTEQQQVTVYFQLSGADQGVRTAWIESVLSYKGLTLRRDVQPAAFGGWNFTDVRLVGGGQYEMTLTILGTKQSKTVTFTKDGPPPAAKFVDASLVESTGEYCCTVLNQPAMTSFSASDLNIAAVFHVVPAGQGLVAQWKYQGQAIGEPQFTLTGQRVESDQGQYVPFYDSYSSASGSSFGGVFSRPNHLPGDYEVVLTLPSGDSRSLKFTLTPEAADASKPKLGELKLSSQRGGAAATSFASFATVYADCGKGPGYVDKKDTLTVQFKYQGAVVGNDWRGDGILAASRTTPLPAGDYEATCFALGYQGEKTVKFTVTSDGVLPPSPTPAASATPRATATP